MKQLQLTDQSAPDLPDIEDRKSLDRFKLFYEEVPMKKRNTSGRLQRPSRKGSK